MAYKSLCYCISIISVLFTSLFCDLFLFHVWPVFCENHFSVSGEQNSRLNKRKNTAKLCAVLSVSFIIIAGFYHMAEMYFYYSILFDYYSSTNDVVLVSDYNLRDIIFILQIFFQLNLVSIL